MRFNGLRKETASFFILQLFVDPAREWKAII